MKANELRIGNLVNVESSYAYSYPGVVQILQIRQRGFKIKGCSSSINFPVASGIPLTEEWLLKFGIKKDKTNDKYFIINDGMAISTAESAADAKFRLIQGNFICQLVIREISYVHELQNLYFALTGEELEIIKSPTNNTNQ